MQNWHAQTDGHPVINRLAVQFTFAIYIPLLLLKLLQKRLAGKLSKEVKASITWKVIEILVNVSPFLAMVISARVAWQFKTGPHNSLYRVQHLRVVGDVQQGLEFISEPQLPHPFIEFFAACIPVTFVAFMEGYSVAYRIASQKGDLRSLNPNQEIWATGIANFVACISSGYPVAGSFSRSSLNAAAGANTQLSTLVTAAVVTVALGSLAQSFYYIPQASLASIIWVAIFNLVDLHDFWSAWKYSKSDFFLITLTFTLEFLFSTEVALTTGLIASLIVFALQAAFNSNTQPRVQLCAQSNSGIEVIKLESTEFGFLNHPAVQALLSTLYRAESKSSVLSDCSDRAFHSVSSALDQALRPTHASTSNVRAVVLDMSPVRVLDWTALMALHEATQETKSRGISVVFINIHDSECVLGMFQKFGIRNYVIQSDTNEIDKELQRYLSMTAIETRIVSDLEAYTDSVDDKGRGEHDSSGTSVRIEEFDVAADYMEKHS